jgi:flagellar basal body L-ring protein FlgH
MDDAERQRTMDFILRHQAQFAAGMQRLEEQQSQFAEQQSQLAEQQSQFAEQQSQLFEHQRRADARTDQLKRIVLQMMQQFRRERGDLRERINALVDAQVRTEEALRSLAATTERNSKDIAALAKVNTDRKTDGEGDGGDKSP